VDEKGAVAIRNVVESFAAGVWVSDGSIGEQRGQPIDDALRVLVDVIDCRFMIEPNQHHSLLASFSYYYAVGRPKVSLCYGNFVSEGETQKAIPLSTERR
jgi:hypothetical protein